MPTTPPIIAALPLPPDPADRSTYNTRAYPWSVALGPYSTQLASVATNVYNNALEAEADAVAAALSETNAAVSAAAAANIANAPAYNDTSSTSLTIGTGTKVFTVTAGKSWGAGMLLTATSGANSMSGSVTSYVGTTLTLDITSTVGSGTLASWVIGLTAIASTGSGGATITGSVTLTKGSPGAMTVINDTSPGHYIILPDATTCATGMDLFAVFNNTDFDRGIKDSTGTQLGWVRPRGYATLGLSDKSTAAGTWVHNLERIGVTANFTSPSLANTGAGLKRVVLDANRTCFLFSGVSLYAVIYDASTLTWGNVTLVVAAHATQQHVSILSATNQVLICYGTSGNTYHSLTLSITGNVITVNAAVAWGTPSSGVTEWTQIVVVGSSWVVGYNNNSGGCIRAVTLSGTVPTISATQTVLSGAAPNLFVSGSVVRTISAITNTIYAQPFTVSGTTLTLGSGASAVTSQSSFRASLNGNGNIVANYMNNNHTATIFKLTGTVEAASTVVLGTAPGTLLQATDYIHVTASKTLFIYHAASTAWYTQLLSDASGTASVGSEQVYAPPGIVVAVALIAANGNSVRAVASTNSQTFQLTYNCSGTSPVLSSGMTFTHQTGAFTAVVTSDRYGIRPPGRFTVGTTVVHLSSYTNNQNSLRFLPGSISLTGHNFITMSGTPVLAGASNELYQAIVFDGITVGITFSRLEMAA